jgi:hypothetical protein
LGITSDWVVLMGAPLSNAQYIIQT